MAVANSLERILIRDALPESQSFVQVRADDTLESVLRTLSKHAILSAPIYDDVSRTYIAFASMFDIMGYILWKVAPEGGQFNPELLSTPIDHICPGFSSEGRSGLWVISQNTSLANLLEPFSKGVHRVLIRPAKAGGDPIIFSQTDLCKFVARAFKLEDFPQLSRTVESLGLCNTNDLVSVSKDASAHSAFLKMYHHGLNAVAIVDEEGKLVSSLSASDIRGADSSHLKDLKRPVAAFVAEMHGGCVPVPRTCKATDTLYDVMKGIIDGVAYDDDRGKWHANSVHRSWIVDESGIVQGCVSLTDIVSKLGKYGW